MGACGTGIFDDDAAFMALQKASEIGFNGLARRAISASESEYIEYDDGALILVCGAIADGVLNGTKYIDSPQFQSIVSSTSNEEVSGISLLIKEALSKVFSASSELNELWQENEELYPEWKENIRAIIGRLNG